MCDVHVQGCSKRRPYRDISMLMVRSVTDPAASGGVQTPHVILSQSKYDREAGDMSPFDRLRVTDWVI